MITGEILSHDWLECERQRETIQQLKKLLDEWEVEIDKRKAGLRTLVRSNRDLESFTQRYREIQLSLPGMEQVQPMPKSNTSASPTELRRRHGRKPDTQVIEEIFREHGPLHVFDLVPIAQEKGVPFSGNKPPSQMARDKMYSCKRFVLFGNNVWGLPDQELPERYKNRGRGNQPLNGVVVTPEEHQAVIGEVA